MGSDNCVQRLIFKVQRSVVSQRNFHKTVISTNHNPQLLKYAISFWWLNNNFKTAQRITFFNRSSSFFFSRNTVGMPLVFSWALISRSHRSCMNSRAFLPCRNPVRFSCMCLGSGNWQEKQDSDWRSSLWQYMCLIVQVDRYVC